MRTLEVRRSRVVTGDFVNQKAAQKGGRMDTRKKQLINLPDDQKAWIMKVVKLAVESGHDSNQTEVIRALIGNAMHEDPESFVTKLSKLKLKARLDDIERRAAALEAEKARIAEELADKQQVNSARV